MTDEIIVNKMRLSFIWFQPILEHWRNAAPLQPFASFFADIFEFAKKLGNLTTVPDEDGWMRPWPYNKGHHMWEYYLETENYGQVNINVLGKHLIPVRAKPWFSIQADWFPGKLIPEIYYFPFGAAFLLTVTYPEKPISFKDGIFLAYELWHTKKITINFKFGHNCKLKDLAGQVMKAMAEHILGENQSCIAGLTQAFSLFTVVQSDYSNPQPVTDGSNLHRYLYALTEWSPSWEVDALPSLAKCALRASK